ncbi:hypothetical protein [Ideonella sp. B508-1]|uniref:hypothetical protein n=1 Tax=Ideonella sp. B508-1 TaxID=137716 RepID=UPI0011D27347|nr:hypothetical protein [Ideonella sp. B508-1]
MASVIPIKSDLSGEASAGCGACFHSSMGPVCHSACEHPREAAPVLSGPSDRVQHVLAALEHALGPLHQLGETDAPPLSLVRALHLADGEAELTLAVAPRCGGALLADAAFDTLRRLLPDTDIYVRHAG